MTRRGYQRRRAANPSLNPHYFLAAYTIRNPTVLWAIRHAALMDKGHRPPCENDVLDKTTLRLLPRPVELRRERTYPR